MRRRRDLAVRVVAVAAVAVTSIILVLSGSRLRAQNPDPRSVKTEPKAAPRAEPLPSPESEPDFSPAPPVTVPLEPTPTSPPTILEPARPKSEIPLAPSRVLPSPSTVFADPEAAANGFVERTTREADDAIQALTKEAESLRARLQKVEAGLNRWQAVKAALESNGGHATWKSRTPAGRQPVDTDVLESIPGAVVEPPISRSRSLPTLPNQTRSPFDLEPAPAASRPALAPVTAEPPTELHPTKPDAVAPPPTAPVPAPKPDSAPEKK